MMNYNYLFNKDRVEHKILGRGHVIGNTYGREIVRVDFDNVGNAENKRLALLVKASDLVKVDEQRELIDFILNQYPFSWKYIIRATVGHIKGSTRLAYQLSYPYILCNDVIYLVLKEGYEWVRVGTILDIEEERHKDLINLARKNLKNKELG